jgi:hypothetical protein
MEPIHVELPGGVTLPASPVNKEIARKMWEASTGSEDSTAHDENESSKTGKATIAELLNEIKCQNQKLIRLREQNEQERMQGTRRERELEKELNAERIERIKNEHECDKRRMQLENVNRELEHQRELDDERRKHDAEVTRMQTTGRNGDGDAGGRGATESGEDDDDLELSQMSISDPATDIVLDLLNCLPLEKRLRNENKDGHPSVSTVTGFYDHTVSKDKELELIITDVMPGTSRRFNFSKFKTQFQSKRKPNAKTMLGCLVKAMHKLCPELRHKTTNAVKKAASLNHNERIVEIEKVKQNGRMKSLTSEHTALPLSQLPGMQEIKSIECSTEMINSFANLIIEHVCFESAAASKLLKAENEWEQMDGRQYTECDKLLSDENDLYDICKLWFPNGVADDFRRFRHLINISPENVQVAYADYLANPAITENENTIMFKSWDECVDIFHEVWVSARCKDTVNIKLRNDWSAIARDGKSGSALKRAPLIDISGSAELSDKQIRCTGCSEDFSFTVRQQTQHMQNGWQNQPGKCDSCKPCNKYFEDGECQFGENCRYSHDMSAETASGKKRFKPGSLDTACRFFADNKCTAGDKCPFQHAGREREQNAEAVAEEKKAAADITPSQGSGGLRRR